MPANANDLTPHPTVKALQGIRVIDVSSFLAGPFCSTQLAEFGAEVIKLELPVVGDALRKFGTMTPSGDSLPWLQETRNKKSVTLDLKVEADPFALWDQSGSPTGFWETIRGWFTNNWAQGSASLSRETLDAVLTSRFTTGSARRRSTTTPLSFLSVRCS